MTPLEYWTTICLDMMQIDLLPLGTALNLVYSLNDFQESGVSIQRLKDEIVSKTQTNRQKDSQNVSVR